MTSSSQQIPIPMDHQQPVYLTNENSCGYTEVNGVPPVTSSELVREQQIVYYNPSVNYQTVNNQQQYQYPQQLPMSQTVNQIAPVGQTEQNIQYQQQHMYPCINMPNTLAQYSMMHFNTNQQQALVSLHQPSVNVAAPPHPSMTNPTGSSTPISASTKRGRNDTSGVSETNVQLRPQYPQALFINQYICIKIKPMIL